MGESHDQQFHSVVLCLASFHTDCTYLAVIGKRYDHAGLADILIESGVLGSGSLAGALDGKHRALHIYAQTSG